MSTSLSPASYKPELIAFASLFYALSAIVWFVDGRMPHLSRWLTVAALVAFVHLGNSWLGVSGFVAFIPLPVVLTAILVSPLAAVATAAVETVLVLLLPEDVVAGSALLTPGAVLAAIWTALGVVYAVYRPIRQLGDWLDEYYERAHRFLEELQNRKAEQDQTIAGLAHANRQLALATERIATLRVMAEEAQKAKTIFLSKVSHEFRTPLNMIVGLVSLMMQKAEIEEDVPLHFVEDLKAVYRNCEHLASMINDVLDLSQMDAGRLTLHRERVNLAEVIDSALAVVRPLTEKKGLDLRPNVPDDIPKVYCDRTRIRQVILNLLSNAAKFTAEGAISLNVVVRDQSVIVSVTDTGPGIAPEDAERIFEPFSQGSSQLWRDKGGSGLGLSISKQFVSLHGGRMWLESEPDAGSSFAFELPISPSLDRSARAEQWIREDWVWQEQTFRTAQVISADQLVRPRVVICDETGGLYHQFSHYTDEVEFIDARSLAQATQALRDCPAHTVVVNAHSLEDLWPLVEAIRPQAPHTPIIGCSVPRQIAQALKVGAVGYLTKPVMPADLSKAIRALDKPVRRVLVVDDDPEVLDLFTRMLHVCSNTLGIVTASNGRQALDVLRETPPDLMLLDVVMPDMDGWHVLEEKGKYDEIRDIPVIFVSAMDPTDHPTTSLALLVTMDEGLSLNQLLRCSLQLPTLLSQPVLLPDQRPSPQRDPAHV